jgi:hypothetical protein
MCDVINSFALLMLLRTSHLYLHQIMKVVHSVERVLLLLLLLLLLAATCWSTRTMR